MGALKERVTFPGIAAAAGGTANASMKQAQAAMCRSAFVVVIVFSPHTENRWFHKATSENVCQIGSHEASRLIQQHILTLRVHPGALQTRWSDRRAWHEFRVHHLCQNFYAFEAL